jgi:GT2 family glycosyltransferase
MRARVDEAETWMGGTPKRAASIIIPNLDGSRHLPALFDHLAAQTLSDFEVLFVDNGSTDDSVEVTLAAARRLDLDLHIIRNAQNRGFAPACNQGLRAAHAPWLVLLNNDTRPEPGWLEQLLAAPEGEPEVGMVASKLLRAANPTLIDSAGIAVDWAGIIWVRQGGQPDTPGDTTPLEVFGPSGGAALYSRAMLDQIGRLDDDFFAYLEDVDLAWRARLAGWRCLLQPQARVLHAHSATLGDASPRKRFLLARNKVWLLIKNYPNPWLTANLPRVLLYDGLGVGYRAATRRDWVALQGRWVGLRDAAKMWEKRREIQRRWQAIGPWRQAMSPTVLPWQVMQRFPPTA